MKILNVKLVKGRKEQRASLVVNNSRPISEFLSLLQAALSIQDSVILGFKDSEGVLLIPSLICSNPELLRTDDYEIILKEKPPQTTNDTHFSHLISDIRYKHNLSDEDYSSLRTFIRENNQMIHQVHHTFLINHNTEGFSDFLFKSAGLQRAQKQQPRLRQIPSEDSIRTVVNDRPSTTRAGDRPLTTGTGERPRTTNNERKGYQRHLQVLLEMETQGMMESADVNLIKGLILRENPDIKHEFESFFEKNISLKELSARLQKVNEKSGLYMERPSSPIPKNNHIQFIVDNFERENLLSAEDVEVVKRMIGEENEFVLSAFDVFESDKDQAELVDSLERAVARKKSELQGMIGMIGNGSFVSELLQAFDEV